MTTEQDEKPKKANDSGTTITGVQLLVGIIFVPVVMRPDCMVSAWGAYLTPSYIQQQTTQRYSDLLKVSSPL